jgi:Mn2+/Fe2+ NRAMP family transporter
MGWPAGVGYSFGEAKQFYGLFGIIVVCGAVPILIPNIPLVTVMYFSQICNGILLPFVLIMMLRLVNNRDLMGDYVNGLVFNIVSYVTIALIIGCTLASFLVPLLGL